MRKVVLGSGLLIVITFINFAFYALFKPEDVLLNQLFAKVLGSAGSDFKPVNAFEYVFYHAFGDALAVLMMMLFVAVLLRVMKMEPSIWFFRFILFMFLILETMQLVMPGNFKWVDVAAYILFYHLGLFLAEWVLERKLKRSLTRMIGTLVNRD